MTDEERKRMEDYERRLSYAKGFFDQVAAMVHPLSVYLFDEDANKRRNVERVVRCRVADMKRYVDNVQLKTGQRQSHVSFEFMADNMIANCRSEIDIITKEIELYGKLHD